MRLVCVVAAVLVGCSSPSVGGMPDAAPDAAPACPDNVDGTAFLDVTVCSGVRFFPLRDMRVFGGTGVAVVDFDGDGNLDILVAGDQAGLGIFLGRGDLTFEDVSESSLKSVLGFAATDLDGDGAANVVLLRLGVEAELVQTGTGYGARRLDPNASSGYYVSGAFGDADLDGRPDLYVGGYLDLMASQNGPVGMANRLWQPPAVAGDPWTDRAGALGVDLGTALTLAVGWTDTDNDGRAEIIAAQDFGTITVPNAALRRNGAAFSDDAATLGLDHRIFSMGVTVFDADGDGLLDIYITNIGANVLAMRRGAGYVDEARARGAAVMFADDSTQSFTGWPSYDLQSPDPDEVAIAQFFVDYIDTSVQRFAATSWSAVAFDYDLDGDVDLFVPNGVVLEAQIPESRAQKDVLLSNQGDGSFVDDSATSGVDYPGEARGAVAADLDGDGDLDLVVADTGILGIGAVRIYRNENTSGGYLMVTLNGQASTPDGLGALVQVTANGVQMIREVTTAGGYASARPATVHFGLGSATVVDELIVRWPSGTVDRLTGVAVNSRLSIVEGSAQ